ncbi:MAG: ribosomal protein S18-alanine N-acetyltransferase [Lachnospiraceae bacterium]|nr:ribosomal protein S18-alanine N-acetyltransferase [Lachnospiraceae bacterium]
MSVEILRMTEADVAAVAALEKDNFSRPWSYDAFYKTLSDDNYIVLLAKEAETLLGYCVLLCTGEEADITNVCTRSEARGKGVATALMTELLEQGKKRGVAEYFLEVREGNTPARGLYQKMGFEEIGMRKNYYEEPKEHAVLMKLERNIER